LGFISGYMTTTEKSDNKTDNTQREDPPVTDKEQPREVGGPKGPEPTRYGDWERKGRCIDF